MHSPVDRYDLTGSPGRAFVVGDVHGCFGLLRAELDRLAFAKSVDTLFLLGDLVDRGRQSRQCVDWLHHPRVRGNHEELTLAAAYGGAIEADQHRQNGGGWFQELTPRLQRELADRLNDAPLAIDLRTPRGRHVGLVHADVDGGDWPAFLIALAHPTQGIRAKRIALWSRTRIGLAERGDDAAARIAGVDHVFFGHNVVSEPATAGNCTWLDTGAGFGLPLTVVEIDDWLDARQNPLA